MHMARLSCDTHGRAALFLPCCSTAHHTTPQHITKHSTPSSPGLHHAELCVKCQLCMQLAMRMVPTVHAQHDAVYCSKAHHCVFVIIMVDTFLHSFMLHTAKSVCETCAVVHILCVHALQVWSWLKALRAQGVEAAIWAQVLGLLLTVGGALWVAVTLVWRFSQTTRSVQELRQDIKAQQQEMRQDFKAQQQELRQELRQDFKAQQQELRQDFKAQQQELRHDIMGKLDQVLSKLDTHETRLKNVEAVMQRQASTQ